MRGTIATYRSTLERGHPHARAHLFALLSLEGSKPEALIP
jgi:hypothetical protein